MLVLVQLTVASLALESTLAVPGAGSISKALGLLGFLAWAVWVVRSGAVRRPHPIHAVMLLFVLWNAASMVWTLDGSATQERVLTYAQLLVFSVVVWEVVDTTAALRQVLLADLVGCAAAAGGLVGGYALAPAAVDWHGRVTLGSFNPNDAGLLLALGLPVALYLLSHPAGTGRWRRLEQVLASGYVPLGTFAVLLTGSRAALAAVVPALCYGIWLVGRRHPSLAVTSTTGVVLLVAGTVPLLPARVLGRLGSTGTDLLQGNLNERQDVWAEAFRLIRQDPLVGVGAGAFRTAAVGVNKVGHNVALGLLAELGPLGLLLFLGIVVVAVRALGAAPAPLRALMTTLVVAWSSAAMLHNWEYRKLSWLLFTLMAASGALTDHDPVARRRTGGTANARGDESMVAP